jgi:hypothetical protein
VYFRTPIELRVAAVPVFAFFARLSAHRSLPPLPPFSPSARPGTHHTFPAEDTTKMSTPKLLAQALPSLRLAPRRLAGSIAQHARCYTRPSAPPLPAATSPSSRTAARHAPWLAPFQRRAFSASPAVSHGHVDPPKPGEEYVLQTTQSGRKPWALTALTVTGSM